MNLDHFNWINPPKTWDITGGSLTFTTEPETDFWQRTYYGFRNDNAHAFLTPVEDQSFSFSVRAAWTYQTLFDQCGILLYQDADNWCKASVEYDNAAFSRLGGVVTNLGYSDWATTDIDSGITHMTFRLNRRGRTSWSKTPSTANPSSKCASSTCTPPWRRCASGCMVAVPSSPPLRRSFRAFTWANAPGKPTSWNKAPNTQPNIGGTALSLVGLGELDDRISPKR